MSPAGANPPAAGTRIGRWLTPPVLAGLVAAILLVMFGHLGGEISEGETAGLDGRCLRAAQALRASTPGMSTAMRDWSGVGSTGVLSFLTVGACGYLALTRVWHTSFLMTLSVVSASCLVHWLKSGFARIRPAPALAEYAETGLSFPSGHTSMSTLTFLTLAMLLARTQARTVQRVYVVGVGAAIAMLVGVSRVALGLHWATDVIGGWAFGIAWATAWVLGADHCDPGRSLVRASS